MLNGKVCVVTGGAQGIGKCIAETFLKNHAKAVYVCDMNISELSDMKAKYSNLYPVELTVTDRNGVAQFVHGVMQEQGHIDVLVNNAGITRDNLLDKMSEQEWDLVLDVNLKGIFNMTQLVAPIMIEQNAGAIVSMSSIVGTDGNIGQTNYAASKGGLIAMSKSWAKEFARKGSQVRVNCIAPGFVETPMTVDLPEKVISYMKGKTPLGRMGKPEDIANGVLFLSSEQSAFVTGQVLKIDGGLVI